MVDFLRISFWIGGKHLKQKNMGGWNSLHWWVSHFADTGYLQKGWSLWIRLESERITTKIFLSYAILEIQCIAIMPQMKINQCIASQVLPLHEPMLKMAITGLMIIVCSLFCSFYDLMVARTKVVWGTVLFNYLTLFFTNTFDFLFLF